MSTYEDLDDIEEEEEEEEYVIHYANLAQDEPYPELDPTPDAEEDILEEEDPDPDTNIDTTLFDDIYEVFRIHTSNLEAITNNYLPMEMDLQCPVCGFVANNNDQLSVHLMYNHPRFFVSLTSTLYPSASLQDIQNIFSMVYPSTIYDDIPQINNRDNLGQVINRLIYNEDEEDVPSYEELLDLCDYIGYHKKGLQNIEEVSTKIEISEEESEDICTICLELLSSKENMRKINICEHKFCSECIEKWFEENKTCPLCKTDLDSVDI